MSQMAVDQARKPVKRTPSPSSGVLQRKYDTGRNIRPILQRAAVSSAPETVPPIVYEVLSSPGQPLDAGTRAFIEPRFEHDFSRVRVHTAAPDRIQTKLNVGLPGDELEQEADRVAEMVLRMPENSNTGRATAYRQTQAIPIQRLCSKCEEELRREPEGVSAPAGVSFPPEFSPEEWFWRDFRGAEEEKEDEGIEILQAKEMSYHLHKISPHLESRIQAFRSGGQPLPESVRTFFEPRLGQDFSQVRIHTDDQAAETAHALNARAYTVGCHIVFGPGQYAPGTGVGNRLMAHELTHVVQQTGQTATLKHSYPVKYRSTSPLLQGSWSLVSDITDEGIGVDDITGNGVTRARFAPNGVYANVRTWQSKPRFQWCVDGGTAQLSMWKSRRYTFRHDGGDNNFLDLFINGTVAGGAKAEDLHYAKSGGAVVGLVKVRTREEPTPPPTRLFIVKDGGKSSANVGSVADIEVIIPIDGLIQVNIPLTATSEGELAAFSETPLPPASHDTAGTTGAETFVDLYLGARAEAVADVESTCDFWEGEFDDVNWARSAATYTILGWRDRAAPGTVAPETGTLGRRRWSCEARCNVEGSEPHCTGHVEGESSGHSSEESACRAAKRDATQKAPRGCHARHCRCLNCTNR